MMEMKQIRKNYKSYIVYHTFPQVFKKKREVVPTKIGVQGIVF